MEVLDKVRPHHVDRHRRVEIEVLAAAIRALEVDGEDLRVLLAQPDPKLAPLAFVVAVPVVELLVGAAQQLREVGRHALPCGEVVEPRLQLGVDVRRLRARLVVEEDVAHVLPALQLVHSRRVRLLRFAHRRPRRLADDRHGLGGDALGEQLLHPPLRVAGVADERAAAGEAAEAAAGGVRPGPWLARVSLLEDLLPSPLQIAQPAEALLVDRRRNRLGRAACRDVDAAQHDDLQIGALVRLDDHVRRDRRVAVLARLVVATLADAVGAGHLPSGERLLDGSHLETAVGEEAQRGLLRLEPRRGAAHDTDDVLADGRARGAVLVLLVDREPVVEVELLCAAAQLDLAP
eukprot:1349010-Prymnesium_polylepis.1